MEEIMKNLLTHWQSAAMAALIVIINLIIIRQMGLAYAHFDWARFAASYGPPQQTSGPITPSGGGTIITADRTFQIVFPAGAVSRTTTVTHTVLFGPAHPLRPGTTGVRHFDLNATDSNGPVTTFLLPYTTVLNYTDAELAAQQIYESSLNSVYWNGSTWVNLLPCAGCTVDMINNRVTLISNHFTEFALVGLGNPQYLPNIQK
jgi:hypothetical protein